MLAQARDRSRPGMGKGGAALARPRSWRESMNAPIVAWRPGRPAHRQASLPRRRTVSVLSVVLLLVSITLWSAARAEPVTLRIGHFPNITHIQALVAHGLSRSGHGWFEHRLGPDVKIEWFVYNAGPSAMEAIFADSIDLTYVGPSPATRRTFRRAHGSPLEGCKSRSPAAMRR